MRNSDLIDEQVSLVNRLQLGMTPELELELNELRLRLHTLKYAHLDHLRRLNYMADELTQRCKLIEKDLEEIMREEKRAREKVKK